MNSLKEQIFPYVRPVYDLCKTIRRKARTFVQPQWRYVAPETSCDPGLEAMEAARQSIVSQSGEDGILLYLADKLSLSSQTCLEVGAWDGKHLSNTWNLIENHGWRGVLIEMDAERFRDLPQAYSDPQKNLYINECVAFTGSNTIDELLKKNGFTGNMDIMSIDIDGDDWYIFESLEEFKPNVIVIEYNPTIPNHVYFVQGRHSNHPAGASLAAYVELGRRKGYEAVFVTITNIILVKKELYPLLGIASNDLSVLRPGQAHQNTIFHGWDGTVYVTGQKNKLWQSIPVAGYAPVYLEDGGE